jgi:hypothetical protein
MNGKRETDVPYAELFDAALAPQRLLAASAGAGAAPEAPAAVLRAMMAEPALWKHWAAGLKAGGLWADLAALAPLDLAETAVLGLLLARDTPDFSSQPEIAISAAAYWYRCALALRAEGVRFVSPVNYYRSVLRPAARAAEEKALASRLGQGLQRAYELALERAPRPDPPSLERMREIHSRVLREMVWPLLRKMDTLAGYRLVEDAWVATGKEMILQSGLVGLLEAAPGAGLESLARRISPEAVAVLLGMLRRSPQPFGDRLRTSVSRLVALQADACASDDRIRILNEVVEILNHP